MRALTANLVGAMILLIGISCTPNNNEQEEILGVEYTMQLTPTLNIPEGCVCDWQTDAAIGVWSHSAPLPFGNIPFTLLEIEEESVFGGTITTCADTPLDIYAMYSYRKNRGEDPTYLAMKLPSQQWQNGEVCDLYRNAILTGCATNVMPESGEAEITLSTPCAIIRVELDAAQTDAATKSITQLDLVSQAPIVGNLVYDLIEGEIVHPASGRAVTLQLDNPLELSEARSLYVVAQSGAESGSVVNLSFLCTDKSTIDMELSLPEALTSGQVTTIPAKLSQLLDSGKAEFNEFRVNLSENGTANCYVVSQPDKYRFTPTKGNSNKQIEGIVRADWLWTTNQNLISNVEYGKTGITFDAGEGEGNAVIAAFDAEDNIVWSWHIWFTDDPTLNDHQGASETYLLMDRNLGATSTTPFDINSYGLYYQWGRKDPFIGQRNAGSSTRFQETTAFSEITATHYVNGNYTFNTATNTETGTSKSSAIDYVTSHPMTFVYNVDATYGKSWWNSTFTEYEDLWGAGTTKSIYDPCPVGYRVPRNDLTFGGDIKAHWGVVSETLESGRERYHFEYLGPDGGDTALGHYPAAGFRYHEYTTHASSNTSADGGSTGYVGAVGNYWSNLLRPKTLQVWMMELDPAADIFYGSRRNNGYSARGCSVRCERE